MKCAPLILTYVLLAVLASRARSDDFEPFPNNAHHNSAAIAAAIAKVPMSAGTVYNPSGQTNDIQIWNFGSPAYTGSYDVSSTLTRIRDGDWMSDHSDDGEFFTNDPAQASLLNIPYEGSTYYMEFIVWPNINLAAGTYDPSDDPFPGMTFPGSMRLLLGANGEVYFSGDHYGEDGLAADIVNPAPVPEPSTVALLALSAIGLLLRCRFVFSTVRN